MYQIIKLYTVNLNNVIRQLYFNKATGGGRNQSEMSVVLRVEKPR